MEIWHKKLTKMNYSVATNWCGSPETKSDVYPMVKEAIIPVKATYNKKNIGVML